MFAGDTESLFSIDTVTPTTPLPTPLPCQTGIRRSKSNANAPRNSTAVDDLDQRLRQVDMREEMFGWSGSIGGIRGRDDRQIERDVEYERKMEERRRRRHERKLARQQQHQLPAYAPNNNATGTPTTATRTGRRVTLASSLPSDIDSLHSPAAPASAPPQNLSRGKSLRERVGAALHLFQSTTRQSPPHPLQRTQSLSAKVPPLPSNHPTSSSAAQNPNGLNRSLTGLVRKLSRRIASDERRSSRDEDLYAEPPTLSHTLVGAASPFPMRPPLSALVGSVPSYGEAHNPDSLDPVRRGPSYHRSRFGAIQAQ